MKEEINQEEVKLYMTEKRIKKKFVEEHLPVFAKMINVDEKKLRLYSLEFPTKTDKDGTKYADVVLEIIENGELYSKDNKLLVLEFKRKKVDYQSAVAQVLRYSDVIQKQLRRTKRVLPFVIADDFSEHETKLAKEHNVVLARYSHKSGIMEMVK